ncbi:MAG: phosphatase [Coriobacteriales bacterium]|nr:phosphatase [Coriobacteriales bacterium]
MIRLAVIDIGTVTARLAIADVEDGRVLSMRRQSTIVNLGQDVDKSGRLREDACARLLACVDGYVAQIREADAQQTCCTLTSAARDASNSAALLGQLAERGLKAQVIPGEVEGKLTFLGVAQDFPNTRLLVADNGGGSTEFALGALASGSDGANAQLDLEFVQSINVGCRRITEKFLSRENPPSAADIQAAHEFAAQSFAPISARFTQAPQRLVVTGGTSTTLVAIKKALVPYDSARVHLASLSQSEIEEQARRLAAITVKERAELPGIQPQRAPVILGGAIAVCEVLRVSGLDTLTVSESDLLMGLSLNLAAAVAEAPSPVGWVPELD